MSNNSEKILCCDDDIVGGDIKIIPISERDKYTCTLCGSHVSVKYLIPTYNPVISNKYEYMPYCNKCALRHISHNEKKG
jgi:hypothetical protein